MLDKYASCDISICAWLLLLILIMNMRIDVNEIVLKLLEVIISRVWVLKC